VASPTHRVWRKRTKRPALETTAVFDHRAQKLSSQSNRQAIALTSHKRTTLVTSIALTSHKRTTLVTPSKTLRRTSGELKHQAMLETP